MIYTIEQISNLLQSNEFHFIAISIAFLLNSYLLLLLIPKGFRSATIKIGWTLLILVLIGTILKDFAWISKYTRKICLPSIPYNIHIFFVRIGWAGMIIQFQALSLFIESLIKKRFYISTLQKIILCANGSLALYFVMTALFDSSLTIEAIRIVALELPLSIQMPLEVLLTRYSSLYMLISLIIPTLIYALYVLQSPDLPKILKIQLRTLIIYFLSPMVLFEAIIGIDKLCKIFFQVPTFLNLSPILSCCTLLFCYSIYHCINKILGLRFLNSRDQVDAPQRIDFVNTFKETLDTLGKATQLEELTHITQQFFKEAFGIRTSDISLIIRENAHQKNPHVSSIEQFIENFMKNHESGVCNLIQKSKILLYDELTFTNFYETSVDRTACIQFLEHINADLFLPIYKKDKVVAYVVIAMEARPKQLYNAMDKSEMVIFANYLGNIIDLIQHRTFETLVQQEQELKQEIYNKEQEIAQYKESLRSFIKSNSRNEVGIIFYKNRRFVFGNQAAKELVKININTQEGHALTKALRALASQVDEYKQPQSQLFKHNNEYHMMICAVPNLEKNNVIITVYHPEISDLLKQHIGVVHDPSKWDYLLYLETTQSGQRINQLIPGSSPLLLNLKIDLLKLGITNHALLINAAEEDSMPMIELIHHISMRDKLKTVEFNKPTRSSDALIPLFGINPLFAHHTQKETSLLEQIGENGTLYIQHVNYLDHDAQAALAHYIRTGYYKAYKSEHQKETSVRIICSMNHSYQQTLHPELQQMLNQTSLSIPSISSLPEKELLELAHGFSTQGMEPTAATNLHKKEIAHLTTSRPVSFLALKARIQAIIAQRTDAPIPADVNNRFVINTNADLSQAAHLGKQALKDEKIMHMLWDTFKNQNKIASFLGVNRSSVNRRCKIYNFQ